MDSFEQVVSEILWDEGLWVWKSFKVKLTTKDKSDIGKTTMPRWEIDIVAYDAPKNIVYVIECKSYFDNPGVGVGWLKDVVSDSKSGFLKIFKNDNMRKVIFNRLKTQLTEEKRCRPNPEIRLGLACGHTKNSAREELREYFHAKGWDLYDEYWLRGKLRDLSTRGYEDQVSAVVAKLLLRGADE